MPIELSTKYGNDYGDGGYYSRGYGHGYGMGYGDATGSGYGRGFNYYEDDGDYGFVTTFDPGSGHSCVDAHDKLTLLELLAYVD